MEFVIGITYDLDGDHYFDPRIRKVIVLDDLMSTAAKDSRINDLFTEGSHHRNLTVIALNQNLYFAKPPPPPLTPSPLLPPPPPQVVLQHLFTLMAAVVAEVVAMVVVVTMVVVAEVNIHDCL